MNSLLFDSTGHARFLPTTVGVVAVALTVAIRSPWGFLSLEGKELLSVVVPIAGTLVALALPAAQLAQSVMEGFLSSAEDLIKANRPIPDIANYLRHVTFERRRDVEVARGVIYFSMGSLVIGLLGELMHLNEPVPAYSWLSPKDFISALACTTLLAAVGWLIPVVKSSFNFAKADKLVDLLDRMPPASSIPAAPPSPAAALPTAPVAPPTSP